MSWGELAAILKADGENKRESWELARLQSFYTIIASAGTKHIKKPTDLFKLPWDNEGKSKPIKEVTIITPEEFNQLIEQVNNIQDGR